jgi:hypothetical protein
MGKGTGTCVSRGALTMELHQTGQSKNSADQEGDASLSPVAPLPGIKKIKAKYPKLYAAARQEVLGDGWQTRLREEIINLQEPFQKLQKEHTRLTKAMADTYKASRAADRDRTKVQKQVQKQKQTSPAQKDQIDHAIVVIEGSHSDLYLIRQSLDKLLPRISGMKKAYLQRKALYRKQTLTVFPWKELEKQYIEERKEQIEAQVYSRYCLLQKLEEGASLEWLKAEHPHLLTAAEEAVMGKGWERRAIFPIIQQLPELMDLQLKIHEQEDRLQEIQTGEKAAEEIVAEHGRHSPQARAAREQWLRKRRTIQNMERKNKDRRKRYQQLRAAYVEESVEFEGKVLTPIDRESVRATYRKAREKSIHRAACVLLKKGYSNTASSA